MDLLRSSFYRRRSRDSMAPPPSIASSGAQVIHPGIREVTEDTPPDLLEGTMELLVILPSTKSVRMTIERRTPMMDLLIHIGTINKLNPGDHIVQVRNERGIELPYKPSTPIGALDTTTIEIVPKNRVNEYIIVKKPSKVANQPFEHTFRLQVHLPRNQLYVMRVSMKTVLQDILKEVCQEKNLDILKYEIRHPANLDEKLPLQNTLGDFGFQEVTVVSKNTKISNSVSSADIMALQQTDDSRGKGYLDSSFKHSRSSVGDSSVSSGSTGSARGLSPTRSDDSRSVSPFPINSSKLSHRTNCISSGSSNNVNHTLLVQKSTSMSNMFSPSPDGTLAGVRPPPRTKKRVAPPPPLLKSQTESALSIRTIANESLQKSTPRKKEAPRLPPIANKTPLSLNQSIQSNHSRHSSGNSEYHDSSLSNSEVHRYDRQSSAPAMLSKQGTASSMSNLTTTSSVSSTSLASSTGGSKKRKAPSPPSAAVLKPQSEIEEEDCESSASNGRRSSKSEKDRQSSSSIEVEVDVHYADRKYSVDSTSTPISVTTRTMKDEDVLSSSPASSLSSPGSFTSASSSPLPRMEVNDSKSKPSSSSPINYYPAQDSSNTSLGQDPSVAASAQAPAPPPRSKSREVLLPTTTGEEPTPMPKPRPKPRPDRRSVDNLIADNPTIIKPQISEEPTKPDTTPAPVLANQLRNPLSRYGVKVLPDNVLKERADRLLAKMASDETDPAENDTPLVNSDLPKKSSAPTRSSPNSKSAEIPISSAKLEVRKKDSGSSFSDSQQYFTASSGDSSMNRVNKSNPNLQKSKAPTQPLRTSRRISTDGDSDNLEENLELFEPNPNIILKPSNNLSRSTHREINKSSISSQDSGKIPSQFSQEPSPKPKPKLGDVGSSKPKVVSASVSDFADLKRNMKEKESPETPSEMEKGLVRTHSDRLKNKDLKTSDGKLLNRWQNVASLNEIDDDLSGASSATKAITNKPLIHNSSSKSSQNPLSHHNNPSMRSSSDDLHDETLRSALNQDDVDDGGITSSESEVSYTDSGVPTTATITPSPMDFDSRISDHDEDDHGKSSVNKKNSDSIGSSRRSSLQSDEEDHWRNVLKEKTLNNEAAMEKAFPSMLPEGRNQSDKEKIHNDPSFASGDSGAEEDELRRYSTSEEEQTEGKGNNSKQSSDAVPIRKLSKSESFSHNSEFDVVKMKRKKSSESTKKTNSKRVCSNVDLSSSLHSSSDEDLRRPAPQEKSQKSSFTEQSKNIGIIDHKTASMHNLTGPLTGEKGRGNHNVPQKEGKAPSMQKTTSLLEIQNLDPRNPDVMNAYQSQLEAQFEQWKLDFLKNHSGETSDSVEVQLKVETHSVEESVDDTPLTNISSESIDQKEFNDVSLKSGEELNVTNFDEQPQPLKISSAPTASPMTVSNSTSDTMDGVTQENAVERRIKPKPAPEYRYSGPPTINMGSWTERPRSSVAVKKDEDYIMGFGQVDSKSVTAESKPAPKLSRTPSYNVSLNSSDKPIYPNRVSLRTVVESVAPTKTVASPTKGISAALNARPVSSSESTDTVGTVKSVLSTWKQRVEGNEKERKSPIGPPPEIDIYGNDSYDPQPVANFVSQKVATIAKEESTESVTANGNMSKLKVVETGRNINESKLAFTQSNKWNQSEKNNGTIAVNLQRNNSLNQEKSKYQGSLYNQVPKHEERNESPTRWDTRTKPVLFKMATMDSKPSTQAKINIESPSPTPPKIENSVEIKSQVASEMQSPENETGPSLKERRKYFQGVQPQNTGKETPMPAVNMKTSIATVQKVFELRQKNQEQDKQTQMIQKSMTLPPKGTAESMSHSPVVIHTSANSTMPKQFQAMSSSEMVQKVLGRQSKPGFDAFRRSPSPVSSTTSTLSRASSSGRDTPSSTDTPDNVVRISTEAKKPAPPPPSNIQNVGNKAIIIINSSNANDRPEVNSGVSVSNNIFKQQQIQSNAKPNNQPIERKGSSAENKPIKKNSFDVNSTKIIINGSPATEAYHSSEKRDSKSGKPFIVEQTVKVSPNKFNASNISATKLNDDTTKKITITENGGVPPPPPPPNPEMLRRPISISINEKLKTPSPKNSRDTTPTSPNSDPRAEIFNVIKNSNGNFGLKKTGSTFLVKK